MRQRDPTSQRLDSVLVDVNEEEMKKIEEQVGNDVNKNDFFQFYKKNKKDSSHLHLLYLLFVVVSFFIIFQIYYQSENSKDFSISKTLDSNEETEEVKQEVLLPSVPRRPAWKLADPDEGCVARPLDYVRDSQRPLILFYTAFWRNEWGNLEDVYFKYFDGIGNHVIRPPECLECRTTTDINTLPYADGVVFFLPNIHELPPKHCGQYFVLFNLEAPPYYRDFAMPHGLTWDEKFLAQFDISSSYRLDSDVPVPHYTFWYEHRFKDALFKPMEVPIEQRNQQVPIAWVASKCKTDNKREKYVEELMQYIPVDSYGRCLHNADIPQGISYDAEAHRVMSSHKFYLSFENANCDYYVTEKLTRCFELGVVPIIYGCPQIKMYLPHPKSAILVSDFQSPKELAEYVLKVHHDDQLYKEYLNYKFNSSYVDEAFYNRWLVNPRHRACKLCDILKNQTHRQDLMGQGLDFGCTTVHNNTAIQQQQ